VTPGSFTTSKISDFGWTAKSGPQKVDRKKWHAKMARKNGPQKWPAKMARKIVQNDEIHQKSQKHAKSSMKRPRVLRGFWKNMKKAQNV